MPSTESALLKNAVSIAIAIVVVAAGAWYLLKPAAGNPEDAMPHVAALGGTASGASENPADLFARQLASLEGVNFQKTSAASKTIFDDPLFRYGLENFTRPLPSIDRARSNPFAPVEGNPAAYVHYGTPAGLSPAPAPAPAATATSPASGTRASTTPARQPAAAPKPPLN